MSDKAMTNQTIDGVPLAELKFDDRLFHVSKIWKSCGRGWVKFIRDEGDGCVRVRCENGAVPTVKLCNLQTRAFTDEQELADFYDELSNGNALERRALTHIKALHRANEPVAQPQGEPVAMNRVQFEAWVLGRAHPVYGWLDKHWITRGDNPENYADPYVQGLWVASQSLYAEQPAPVAVEYKLHMGEALKVFEALKVSRISRKVEQEDLGPMGATEIETWSTAIGVTLEMRTSMGGCTLIVRAAPVSVVLPERREPKHYWPRFGKLTATARVAAEEWNACLDKVTLLYGIKS